MKAKFTLLAFLLYSFFNAQAQEPALVNGGFESWNDSVPSFPTGWDTGDNLIHEYIPVIPQKGWAIKDTTPANVFAGSASVRLRTDTVSVVNQIAPGIVTYGILRLDGNENPFPIALPFTGRPTVFSGNFKFQPVGQDIGQYQIFLSKWDAVGDSEIVVAYENKNINNTNGAFVGFSDTLQYLSSERPDSIIIAFSSGLLSGSPIAGSILWVDNLAFEYLSTGIQHFDADDAIKIFPNPTANVLNIQVDNYMTGYGFNIYDLSGKLVKTATIENADYSLSVAGLADGAYTYAVTNKQGKVVGHNKFTVIK